MLNLLLLFAIFHAVHSSCPTGFVLQHEGECRGLLVEMILYHDEAYEKTVAKCKEIQGQPVIIHNYEQQYYWMTLQKPNDPDFILGLTCDLASKKWIWADGSPLDYTPPEGTDDDMSQPCTSGCSVYLHSTGKWHVWCDKNAEYINIHCTYQLPLVPTPSPDGCQTFEDDSDDGVCYQVAPAARTWNDAQFVCESADGELASIHNDKENSFVRRLAVSKGAVNGIFIGAIRPANGNKYTWIDGSKWDYDNFAPGYPIQGRGDCVVMSTQDSAGQWMNTDCSAQKAAACGMPQSSKVPQPPKCDSGKRWKAGEIITSPGFPFDASIPCDYLLMSTSGKKIQLEVIFLEANSCCDYLYLYNDFDNQLGILAGYSGELQNKTSPVSYSNYMSVSWKPQGAVNVRGAMFRFREV